jgi:hypothetical protein
MMLYIGPIHLEARYAAVSENCSNNIGSCIILSAVMMMVMMVMMVMMMMMTNFTTFS